MSSSASAEGMHRKRMRKGTRSCLECRTRKIRCIFSPGSRICNGCKAHGKTCVEQTYNCVKEAGLDKRVGLKDRVKELEALVNQLMEKGHGEGKVEIPERYKKKLEERKECGGGRNGVLSPPDSNQSGIESPSTQSAVQLAQNAIADIYDAVDELDDDNIIASEDGFAKSAVRTLFDNAIISHEPAESPKPRNMDCTISQLSRRAQARHNHFAAELKALIPQHNDLTILLNTNVMYEPIWQRTLTPDIREKHHTMESAIRMYFGSEDLIDLCKGLLYLALVLQQLPPDSVQHRLRLPDKLSGKELIQKYIDTVGAYLMSSDKIIGTLEGMECNSLMTQLLINDGRPRKAWLCFQRSIDFAKLLGYHRPSSWKSLDNNTRSLGKRREGIWWTLYQGDRYLALILGLPYAISDKHVDVDSITSTRPGEFIDTTSFMLKLAVISGRIIDRNQGPERSNTNAFANAMALDGELHALSCLVPDSWWDTDISIDSEDSLYESYARFKAIFWHNECRLILHMPFMMKTLQKEENSAMYAYNRTVALSSSRMMIRCHQNLRTRPEFICMVCQVIDFQVFTATMLLLLDMLERPDLNTDHQESQTIEDTELIVSVIGTLRKVSKESSGRCDIAGQAVSVLDGVTHVIYGCPSPNIKHPSRVVIPYFGAVTIKPVGKKKSCKCCPPAVSTDEEEGQTPRISAAAKASRGNRNSVPHPTTADFVSVASQGSQVIESQPQQNHYAANDFITFDSFIGAGTRTRTLSGSGNESLAMANNQNGNGLHVPIVGSDMQMDGQDVTMWDETLWQNMLQQDPSLDLDGDWSWLQMPVS